MKLRVRQKEREGGSEGGWARDLWEGHSLFFTLSFHFSLKAASEDSPAAIDVRRRVLVIVDASDGDEGGEHDGNQAGDGDEELTLQWRSEDEG